MRWMLIAGLSLLLTSCVGEVGGNDRMGFSGSPEEAVEQLLKAIEEGQRERQWLALHPDQQKLIDEEAFLACSSGSPSLDLVHVDVLEVRGVETQIPGTKLTAPAKAVAVRFVEANGSSQQEEAQGTCVNCATVGTDTVGTYYLFQIDGRWRWAVADPAAYAGGRCP